MQAEKLKIDPLQEISIAGKGGGTQLTSLSTLPWVHGHQEKGEPSDLSPIESDLIQLNTSIWLIAMA